jgi:hypothetical protein
MEIKISQPTNAGTRVYRKATMYITTKRYYKGRRKGKKDQRVCGGNVNHENFECNMHIREEAVADFECANLKH